MTPPPATGFPLVVFDCDSTLTTLEGIDELSQTRREEIAALTEQAMSGGMDFTLALDRRLAILQPTRGQLEALGERYAAHPTPDARAVIAALHALGKAVYIVSGGFKVALDVFGRTLGLEGERVVAVDLAFDAEGRYHAVRREGEWNVLAGKDRIVTRLQERHGSPALVVGDGATDLATAPVAGLFAGYGGVAVRERVRAEAPVFLPDPSLAPVLALAASAGERKTLRAGPHGALLEKGETLLRQALHAHRSRD